MRTLARHVGLPEAAPVAEVVAEINKSPIAASQVNREAKRQQVSAAAALAKQQEISKEIAAAIGDGRIPSSAAPKWRGRLTVYGDSAVRELRGLRSVTAILAASEAQEPVEPPSMLAARPVSITSLVAPSKSAVSTSRVAASADPGVVADPASGELSWQGLPVTSGADGAPLVHTTSGAMTPAAFKAAGLDVETERAAVGMSRLMGTEAKSGLAKRNMLFGGS
jgi:hypothetical protein